MLLTKKAPCREEASRRRFFRLCGGGGRNNSPSAFFPTKSPHKMRVKKHLLFPYLLFLFSPAPWAQGVVLLDKSFKHIQREKKKNIYLQQTFCSTVSSTNLRFIKSPDNCALLWPPCHHKLAAQSPHAGAPRKQVLHPARGGGESQRSFKVREHLLPYAWGKPRLPQPVSLDLHQPFCRFRTKSKGEGRGEEWGNYPGAHWCHRMYTPRTTENWHWAPGKMPDCSPFLNFPTDVTTFVKQSFNWQL